MHAARQETAPRNIFNALSDHDSTIHIGPPFKRYGIVLRVKRIATVEVNGVFTCGPISLNIERRRWHFIVQLDLDRVRVCVPNPIPCDDVEEERLGWVVGEVVKGVGQLFGTSPLIVPCW